MRRTLLLGSLVWFAVVACSESAPAGPDDDGDPQGDPDRVASVIVVQDGDSVEVGDSLRLAAAAVQADGDTVLDVAATWSTSAATLELTADGRAYVLGEGAAQVRATYQGVQGIGTLHGVLPSLAGLDIVESTIQLQTRRTARATVVLTGENGDTLGPGALEWESSDPSVASVSEDGLVLGVSQGTVTVRGSVEELRDSVIVEVAAALGGISAQDAEALTSALESLSVEWHQPSIPIANDILWTLDYTPGDWTAFFAEYFGEHELTNALADYLVYPLFYWGFTANRERLQPGILNPIVTLVETRASELFRDGVGGLEGRLTGAPHRLQSIAHGLRLLHYVGSHLATDPALEAEVHTFARAHVGAFPAIYRYRAAVGPATGAVLGQAWTTTIQSAPDGADPAEVGERLFGLQAPMLDLLSETGVLVLDAGGLDAGQWDVLNDLLTSVDKDLHDLGLITVRDLYGWGGDVPAVGSAYGVNIFGMRVGDVSENGFPADVEPWPTDVFSIVAAHELYHRVACCYVERTPWMNTRFNQLLGAAGNEPNNYLRSMFEPGFFQNAPQEFIASIANQWIANSFRTLELGRVRFAAGTPHPLNQALFFVEIHSRGGDESSFYTLDTSGTLTHTRIPVGRDGNGNIDHIELADSIFRFARQPNGDVLSMSAEGR